MKRLIPCLLLASCLLGACANTPPATFYTLDGSQTGAPLASGRGPSLVITRVTLPDLVDRPQLVIRGPGNQVSIDEQQRWAEPLKHSIPRLLAEDLGRELDSNRVSALPLDQRQFAADYRLQVDIRRFDVIAGVGAVLDVQWHLDASNPADWTSHGQRQFSAAVGSQQPGTLIEAQRRLLAQAAAAIARTLPAPRR